jgi:hypothetical protein
MGNEPTKPGASPATLPPALSPTHPMAAPDPDAGPGYSRWPLRALKLAPGLMLQAQRLAKEAPVHALQYLGAIEGRCLFVVPVGAASLKAGVQAGEPLVVRGFTGRYDLQFVTKVIQSFDFTFREPAYAYAVLEFPGSVQARKARETVRIGTSTPATASPGHGREPVDVNIVDLSVDGALLDSPVDLGEPGDLLSLAFSLGPDDNLAYVEVLARICHRRSGVEGALYGVLFETLSSRDRLALREFAVEARE